MPSLLSESDFTVFVPGRLQAFTTKSSITLYPKDQVEEGTIPAPGIGDFNEIWGMVALIFEPFGVVTVGAVKF